MCRLRHPHILCSLGVYEPSDGPVSIVLQRIDSTLAEQINHPMHRTPCDEWFLRRHWPIERAILVGTQLASALAYMHEKVSADPDTLHSVSQRLIDRRVLVLGGWDRSLRIGPTFPVGKESQNGRQAFC